MNKVVRKEMLAGELPDLLRGEFAADEAVEVMVRSRGGNRRLRGGMLATLRIRGAGFHRRWSRCYGACGSGVQVRRR